MSQGFLPSCQVRQSNFPLLTRGIPVHTAHGVLGYNVVWAHPESGVASYYLVCPRLSVLSIGRVPGGSAALHSDPLLSLAGALAPWRIPKRR